MSEENSWRTSLPSSSTGTGDQTVVRPDSLTIGSTAISMDILTPQLLQFIQSCQNTAGSATSTPDNKVLDPTAMSNSVQQQISESEIFIIISCLQPHKVFHVDLESFFLETAFKTDGAAIILQST
ncbi:unnamed protein product [Rodentolepis nana]|uniref:Uncharacterized protein n=1 Tax=Rodentolepis nana TaxID=102285 RepID=A0A0R3TTT0_RODNA|nr:unnamed protein product [Rodentolepis nana]